MSLLLDQNISFRVVKELSTIFSGTIQVSMAGLSDKTDLEIWMYAKEKQLMIVTFDADFAELANLRGSPPKVLWLRFLDQRSTTIVAKLSSKADEIKSFAIDSSYSVLEIR